MEFRLIYRGRLPAEGSGKGGTRVEEKHSIRRELHRQLKVLWTVQPLLSRYMQGPIVDPENGIATGVDMIADSYSHCGYRFVPLVREDWGIACSLDILFLRRDGPGSLIKSGGDIDNRVKVLFDALRVPRDSQEIPKNQQVAADENPFFCLLEDDALITQVSVTTDRLLLPMEAGESLHDVVLIVRVKTIVVDTSRAFRVFD